MSRPSRDLTWLDVARVIAGRSTCLRRAVGCVLLDARGHVLSTGYNGVAAGQPHCDKMELAGADFEELNDGVRRPRRMVETYPNACPGAGSVSGTNLDGCRAVHAEQNALLQCRDPWSIEVCYCTSSPCLTCVKLLMATSCMRVVFLEEYPHEEARSLWVGSSPNMREPREWVQLT